MQADDKEDQRTDCQAAPGVKTLVLGPIGRLCILAIPKPTVCANSEQFIRIKYEKNVQSAKNESTEPERPNPFMGQFWPEKQINDAGHGGRSIIDHFPVDINSIPSFMVKLP